MDQQVSPAVVVIVLILIAAILVGLYFLVVDRKSQATEEPVVDPAAGEMAMPAEPAADTGGAVGPAADETQADQSEIAPANSSPDPATAADPPADAGATEPAAPGGGG